VIPAYVQRRSREAARANRCKNLNDYCFKK
jgi:hypothetical protein